MTTITCKYCDATSWNEFTDGLCDECWSTKCRKCGGTTFEVKDVREFTVTLEAVDVDFVRAHDVDGSRLPDQASYIITCATCDEKHDVGIDDWE